MSALVGCILPYHFDVRTSLRRFVYFIAHTSWQRLTMNVMAQHRHYFAEWNERDPLVFSRLHA
jgi:hypothetical protein